MNHLGMDHGGMDHGGMGGGHGGMDHGDGGMDMGGKCSMHMLWNTQIVDTCVVFPQWHIRSTGGFVLSCLAIAALGVFYEWLRAYNARVDRSIARRIALDGKGKGRVSLLRESRSPSPAPAPAAAAEEDALLTRPRFFKSSLTPIPVYARILRASLYASTVFLSFFLMLVFMTYNAYLIISVVLGAALGHYIQNAYIDVDSVLFGGADGKGMACH